MIIVRQSPFTGKFNVRELDITEEQCDRWANGELIQVAFPNLSPDDREFFKTGITPEEWDEFIGSGEE
jgi:hypothetical protein